jgi:hypothetical protein
MSTFRKSTFSHDNGCVEVANLDGTTAVRNSKHPDRGTLVLDSPSMAAWVDACAAGEFDDHT